MSKHMNTIKIYRFLWVMALLLSMPAFSAGSILHQPIARVAAPVLSASIPAGIALVLPQAEPVLTLFLPWVETGDTPKSAGGRLEATNLWASEYLPSDNVDPAWTGSHDACSPGDTSPAFKEAVLRRVNYFRVAAGVPVLMGLNPQFNQKAQAAALMMSRNRNLSHTPPNNWLCFSADGKQGAGSSNLALGMSGAGAIVGYMRDDGNGNEAAGHRRWILHPPAQQMGTGDIPATNGFLASNALYIFDGHSFDPRPAVRDDFVAWPPKGFIPYAVVFQRWSFAYPKADFSGALVTVTHNGAQLPLVQYQPVEGYGENTLVWEMTDLTSRATWPKPAADTTYVVTVQNVMVGGQLRVFTYEVVIFDPAS